MLYDSSGGGFLSPCFAPNINSMLHRLTFKPVLGHTFSHLPLEHSVLSPHFAQADPSVPHTLPPLLCLVPGSFQPFSSLVFLPFSPLHPFLTAPSLTACCRVLRFSTGFCLVCGFPESIYFPSLSQLQRQGPGLACLSLDRPYFLPDVGIKKCY